MKLFDINYKRMVVLLLPTFLRKAAIVALLRAATRPISTLHGRFADHRRENLFRLQMNGQRRLLQAVLNTKLPGANNSIRIEEEAVAGNWQYAWSETYDTNYACLLIDEEGTLFWSLAAITSDKSRFTVVAPAAINTPHNNATIRSLVNNYKLLSKPYTIRYE